MIIAPANFFVAPITTFPMAAYSAAKTTLFLLSTDTGEQASEPLSSLCLDCWVLSSYARA